MVDGSVELFVVRELAAVSQLVREAVAGRG